MVQRDVLRAHRQDLVLRRPRPVQIARLPRGKRLVKHGPLPAEEDDGLPLDEAAAAVETRHHEGDPSS